MGLSFYLFFVCLLKIKPRALCMLGKHSTTKLYPQPCNFHFKFVVIYIQKLRYRSRIHKYVFIQM
jgi:hypothetical protein